MKFGIHNPSWLCGSALYHMFEGTKAKEHGFAWFSVMDQLTQLLGVIS